MFQKNHFISKSINENIPLYLQIYMWNLINSLKGEKDWLQVFELSGCNGNQELIHSQEVPKYKRKYILKSEKTINCKIFVIDSVEYSTMIMNYEY